MLFLVIAFDENDPVRLGEGANPAYHRRAMRPLVHQIPDKHDGIIRSGADARQQRLEFGQTTMHIANNDIS